MCGRFTLASPAETIAGAFELAEVPELAPRYNIAPTEPIAAIRSLEPVPEVAGEAGKGGRTRILELRRWGLVPHWTKELSGPPLFNARAETVAERPAFRDAFRQRRCLVPADGFYEWSEVSGRRQPFHLRRKDRGLFAIAGLYERWRPPEGEPIESCTLVTTEANALLAPIHERMPVILSPESFEAWLDPATPADALAPLLRPAGAEDWTCYPVDPRVNRAGYDTPGNVEPLFDEAS